MRSEEAYPVGGPGSLRVGWYPICMRGSENPIYVRVGAGKRVAGLRELQTTMNHLKTHLCPWSVLFFFRKKRSGVVVCVIF